MPGSDWECFRLNYTSMIRVRIGGLQHSLDGFAICPVSNKPQCKFWREDAPEFVLHLLEFLFAELRICRQFIHCSPMKIFSI